MNLLIQNVSPRSEFSKSRSSCKSLGQKILASYQRPGNKEFISEISKHSPLSSKDMANGQCFSKKLEYQSSENLHLIMPTLHRLPIEFVQHIYWTKLLPTEQPAELRDREVTIPNPQASKSKGQAGKIR
jgi:hypothetical protein